MGKQGSEDMDGAFKALADGGRRKLLDALHDEDGLRLSELCGMLDMSRQAVSKHLAILEEAGLIVPVWRGREKLHYLNPQPLRAMYERWIRKFDEPRLAALTELKSGLERSDEDKGD
jgi:DNA-binding transcriptional ArsR family regulator